MTLPRTLAPVLLVVLALALSGCSGSGRLSELPPPPPAKPAPNPFQARVQSRSYVFRLTGDRAVPVGPGRASASAAVTVQPDHDQVCWKITRMTGVSAPLHAYIHRGSSRIAGPVVIPLGGRFTPAGCITGIAPALLAGIESRPRGYYLSIHNQKYPAGAVRGQL